MLGAISGAAAAVSTPLAKAYEGYKKGGAFGAVTGFGVGLGAGVVLGSAFAVGGAMTGVYQLGRGVINARNSISSSQNYWDDENRQWIAYNLPKDAERFLNMSDEEYLKIFGNQRILNDDDEEEDGNNTSTKSKSSQYQSTSVKDMSYYNVLGVSPTSTTAEIKRAFYMKAKQSHPDHNPNDPTAQERFQTISEAYQVLSDPSLRKKYDLEGKGSLSQQVTTIDPRVLYAMTFGSEKFELYIGKLNVVIQSELSEQYKTLEQDNPIHFKIIYKLHQKKRELSCAISLTTLLQQYIDSEESFTRKIKKELNELTASPLGTVLTRTIGESYLEAANAAMNSTHSLAIGLQQTKRMMSQGLNLTSSGMKASYLQAQLTSIEREAVQRSIAEEEERRKKTPPKVYSTPPPRSGTGRNNKRRGTTTDRRKKEEDDDERIQIEVTFTSEEIQQIKQLEEELKEHMISFM